MESTISHRRIFGQDYPQIEQRLEVGTKRKEREVWEIPGWLRNKKRTRLWTDPRTVQDIEMQSTQMTQMREILSS